ncbi:MAG: DUF262 domain-containing protein [Bacteroidota bacterium]|nr:DUF262 domain-containing protein [Bacteroidota bacterium]
MSEDFKFMRKVEEEEVGYVMKQPFNPSKIKIRPQTITVDAMVERIRHGEIDLSTKFQRKEGLWTDEQQSRLIESILIRFPLPVFYFDGSDNDKWLVIDGLQRLTSLKRFMVTKDLKLTGLEYLPLNRKGWDDLDRPQQRQINETQLQSYVLEEGEENVKFNIFKRINTGGLTLSSQEIRHAMHQNVSDFLQELAESRDFLLATGKKISIDRMQDRDFVNRFLAFYLLDYTTEYLKEDDLDTFMNRALVKLSKLNETEKEHIANGFRESMKLSHQIFRENAFSKQPKPNRINKALFEVISVSFSKLDKSKKEILLKRRYELKNALHKAIKEKFKDSLSSGTGGQSNVHLRHKEFKNVLNSILMQ